jgi:hypothetical protein
VGPTRDFSGVLQNCAKCSPREADPFGTFASAVDVIENPKLEAYSSPFIAETIARYQGDPEAFEAEVA